MPEDIILCADANQTLSLEIAKKFIVALEARGVLWLEEPFAPDNIVLFEELIKGSVKLIYQRILFNFRISEMSLLGKAIH